MKKSWKNVEEKGKIDVIEVKEMTDEYVFDRCPLKTPLNPLNLPEDTYPGYGKRAKGVRRRFFQEVKNRYGNCVLFAWNDNEIIGFLIFLPKTVARKIGLKTSSNDNLLHQTLQYVCMQLVSAYRKKGVGTKMMKSLITWAKNNGWKRIEAHNMRRGNKDEDWRWGWALPKWMSMGFKTAEQYELDFLNDKIQVFSVVLDID